MAYNENHAAKLKDLVSLANKTKTAIEEAITNLPKEQFLDQSKSGFVPSFAFNSETYSGATDPNMEGKPVLVLALKGVDNKTKAEVITYSFLNVAALVDTYTAKSGASSQILNIAGYEIEVIYDNTLTATANGLGVAVSAVANAITKQSDGLHVDISGKTDKVDRATSATAANPYDETEDAQDYADFNTNYALTNHVVILTADGNIKDSGILISDVITKADLTTDAEVLEALTSVFNQE